jgi:hypothetical protein
MTKIDLEELERKAGAAASGPWCSHGDRSRIPDYTSQFAIVTDDGCQQIADAFDNTRWPDEQCIANAQHIASNSPPVTLALIARIRELENAAKELLDIVDEHAWGFTVARERTAALLEKGAVLP